MILKANDAAVPVDGILSALENRCVVTGSPVSVTSAVTLGGKLRALLATDGVTQMHSVLTKESRVIMIICIFKYLPKYCTHAPFLQLSFSR